MSRDPFSRDMLWAAVRKLRHQRFPRPATGQIARGLAHSAEIGRIVTMSRPAVNSNKPAPWPEVATRLVDVATGRSPADFVVRNGRWVNVHSGEVIAATDIAVVAGRFAYCGPDASHAIGT